MKYIGFFAVAALAVFMTSAFLENGAETEHDRGLTVQQRQSPG